MTRTNMNQAERFFYNHAGFSYDPKTETSEQGKVRCAKELAEAERVARNLNWEYRWSDDWSVGSHQREYGKGSVYENGEPDSCESCVLVDEHGEHLASLHCIDDADANYRRVVEAELASEALYEYDRETEVLDAH